jgi:hypothetical protein
VSHRGSGGAPATNLFKVNASPLKIDDNGGILEQEKLVGEMGGPNLGLKLMPSGKKVLASLSPLNEHTTNSKSQPKV